MESSCMLCHTRHQPNPFSPRHRTIHRFRSLLASQSTDLIPQSRALSETTLKSCRVLFVALVAAEKAFIFTESADIFRAREGVLCDSDRSRWIFWPAFDCGGYFRWCLFILAVPSGVRGGRTGKIFQICSSDRSAAQLELYRSFSLVSLFERKGLRCSSVPQHS